MTITIIILSKTVKINCEEKCAEINEHNKYVDPQHPDRTYPVNLLLSKEQFTTFTIVKMISETQDDTELFDKSLRLSKAILKMKALGGKVFVRLQDGRVEEVEYK